MRTHAHLLAGLAAHSALGPAAETVLAAAATAYLVKGHPRVDRG